VEHVRQDKIDAELRDARREGIRQLAGTISFPDDPEIFPLSVYTG
jgi:hypothetical protein